METALQQSAATAGGARGAMRPAGAATTVKKARQELELEQEELRFPQAAAAADQGGLDEELRRGPWTVDEDLTLINYIADHGEGRWNVLARAAGLKRTGKSCRLRWLNYLRPDVKRGDFTADEQLLILDLHSRWGNRWSKIAAHLPGRTDNEIKNYWRTRVQKHAKQLNCDVNSKRFKDAMRFLWMPRLAERAATAAHQPQHVAVACSNNVLVAAAANSSSCCWSPRSAVTTAACSGSSSCSSLTSESAHNDDDGARPHAAAVLEAAAAVAGDDDYWGAVTTTMQQHHHQQQPNDQFDFWSTASALQHLTTAADQDLTGWVQGFSDDGILSGSSSDSLWSLDDIWRMQ